MHPISACCISCMKHIVFAFFRLKELLRAKLIECGWRDQLKALCKGKNTGPTCLRALHTLQWLIFKSVSFIDCRRDQGERNRECYCRRLGRWSYSQRKRLVVLTPKSIMSVILKLLDVKKCHQTWNYFLICIHLWVINTNATQEKHDRH